MQKRTSLLIIGIVALILLATGSTVGAMVLTHSGLMSNRYSNGMMNGTSGYQGMMGNQGNGGMMGGSQQNPTRPGTPMTGVTHMSMQNVTYQYRSIQVRAGTTVTWTNRDSVPHSVTFQNGMKDSGLLSQGQSFSYTFNTPGTYQYYCTVHPSMVATVTVVP